MNLRAAHESDREFISHAIAEAFLPSSRPSPPPDELDLGDRWILEVDGRQVATARSTGAGQLFLGRSIPSALVRSVAVPGTSRGRGLGAELIRRVLIQARTDGLFISTLFASVPGVYRRAGYEIGGERTVLQTAPERLPVRTSSSIVFMEEKHLPGVFACYEEAARHGSGLLKRDDRWWREMVLRWGSSSIYRYVFLENEAVTGYAVCRKADAKADLPYYYVLEVTDCAWTTPAASDALLAMMRSHQGLGVAVRWPSRGGDPWAAMLAPDAASVHFCRPWMVRLVDVERALDSRGYLAGIESAVEFAVEDRTLAENNGAYRLEVSGGSAVVKRIAEARMSFDVSTLAAMFTGWADPGTFKSTGRISGADEADVRNLASVFAAPRPWLPEFF